MNIQVYKSPGPGGVYPKLLRETREDIAKALTKIFATSLARCEIPEDGKESNVVPLVKNGSGDKPGNYSPVSLTSVVGNVLERIGREWVDKVPNVRLIQRIKSMGLTVNWSYEHRTVRQKNKPLGTQCLCRT